MEGLKWSEASFNWLCHDLDDAVLSETHNGSCHVMLILTTVNQTRKHCEIITNDAYAPLWHLNFRLANLISGTLCIWTTKAECCEINQFEKKIFPDVICGVSW